MKETLEKIRKQVEEKEKECNERIANNEDIQQAYKDTDWGEGHIPVPFYTDENSEVLNSAWIDQAADIAEGAEYSGWDGAAWDDGYKYGMRHVLDLLGKAMNEPVTLDGCCDNCGKSKPEEDGFEDCEECRKLEDNPVAESCKKAEREDHPPKRVRFEQKDFDSELGETVVDVVVVDTEEVIRTLTMSQAYAWCGKNGYVIVPEAAT